MKRSSRIIVSIRPATKKDFRSIFQLAKMKELRPPNRPSAEQIWIRDHLRKKQILLVAIVNNKVVGFIMGEKLISKVFIQHLIGVTRSWRRTGIASRLITAFEQAVVKRGGSCVLGYAVASSTGIHRLLKKHNYQPGSLVREYQKFL